MAILDERPGLLVLLGHDHLPRTSRGCLGVSSEFPLELSLKDLGEEGPLGVGVAT